MILYLNIKKGKFSLLDCVVGNILTSFFFQLSIDIKTQTVELRFNVMDKHLDRFYRGKIMNFNISVLIII